MKIKNLVIYQFSFLYEILKEIDKDLNFKIIKATNEKLLNSEIKNLDNYLVITKKKILNIDNQIILNQLPIKISRLFVAETGTSLQFSP